MPEGNKLLRKLIPGLEVTNDGETPYTYQLNPPGDSHSGWEIVNNGTTRASLVYRGYFDLGGFVADKLTTFVLGTNFQQSNSHLALMLEPTGAVHCWRMLTKRKVDDEDFEPECYFTSFTMFSPPGMAHSKMDLEEVFSGTYERSTPDTSVEDMLVRTNLQKWGTGSATAGDRLHITLVYLLAGNLQTPVPPQVAKIIIPDQAVVVPVVISKEKDLVHLERLRRSYVHWTSSSG